MKKKRRQRDGQQRGLPGTGRRGRAPAVGVRVERAKSGDGWVFVHPYCVRARAEDLEEVQAMIDAGTTDVAIDELRWLLDGCSEFIEAHRLLGELALTVDRDLPLARGHLGAAYQLGLTALRRAGSTAPLLYRFPANQGFFNAGKRLAWCLNELGKERMASEVIEHLLACDPSDPLGLREMLAQIRARSAALKSEIPKSVSETDSK